MRHTLVIRRKYHIEYKLVLLQNLAANILKKQNQQFFVILIFTIFTPITKR